MIGCDALDLEMGADHPDRDAGEPAEQREQHGFDQELGEDRAALRPDRLPDADLAGALGDGDEHDVHHPDPADEQRDRGDRAERAW